MVRLSKMHGTRYILFFAFFTLIFLGLFAACSGQQQTQDPAGTSARDPAMPQFTEATHGIVDTTGTVSQDFLAQLRSRSDTVQTQGYQIAVVFFNNLVSDPHQFATDVFNKNGIGFKDTNNGVLFVFYLQKPGKDGPAPWLAYITGGGISGALPDTLMDDYVQTTFVPARAQGQWQGGLLAFYDKVATAERDPSVAREWQTTHPKLAAPVAGSSRATNSNSNPVGILLLVSLALAGWLGISAVVASRRRENFFYTAIRLLGRIVFILVLFSRGGGGGGGSGNGGSGSWGGGGSSSSSGGDV